MKLRMKQSDVGLDMNTNILNIRWVSVESWLCFKEHLSV